MFHTFTLTTTQSVVETTRKISTNFSLKWKLIWTNLECFISMVPALQSEFISVLSLLSFFFSCWKSAANYCIVWLELVKIIAETYHAFSEKSGTQSFLTMSCSGTVICCLNNPVRTMIMMMWRTQLYLHIIVISIGCMQIVVNTR